MLNTLLRVFLEIWVTHVWLTVDHIDFYEDMYP